MTPAIFCHNLIVIFWSTYCYFLIKSKSASIIIKLDTTKNWVILNEDDTITITHYNPKFKCKHVRIVIYCDKASWKIAWVNITHIKYVKNITNSNGTTGTGTSRHFIIIWVSKNNRDYHIHILNKGEIVASSKITRRKQ